VRIDDLDRGGDVGLPRPSVARLIGRLVRGRDQDLVVLGHEVEPLAEV